MGRKIKIMAPPVEMKAELNDTETAKKIWDILPISASGNRWGEEIYFSISVKTSNENPQETVEVGDLAYWPPGPAFCIFFGPTPVSLGNEIKPTSVVTVLGKLLGDPQKFKEVKNGTRVTLEKS